MMASKGIKAFTILTRCIKAPLHVLLRARDFYVNSMTNCAGRGQGPARGFAGIIPVSRSRSNGFYRSTTSEEDIRDLIRAASRAGMRKQPAVAPRSQSVGLGRIDEDGPGELGDSFKLAVTPRSKSCSVAIGGGIGKLVLPEAGQD